MFSLSIHHLSRNPLFIKAITILSLISIIRLTNMVTNKRPHAHYHGEPMPLKRLRDRVTEKRKVKQVEGNRVDAQHNEAN